MNYKNRTKINNGFTLVELLAMISLLSIISVVVIYTSMNIINNTKNKSYMVTINNIQKEASTYVLENNKNIFWINYDSNILYQCVTVQNLIDMGYFDNNILNSKIVEDRKVLPNDYVYIEKDANTNVITKNILLYGQNSQLSSLCGDYVNATGNIIIDVPSGWKKQKDVVITYKLDSSIGDSSNYRYGYSLMDNSGNYIIDYKEFGFNNIKTVSKTVVIASNGILNALIIKKDGTPLFSSSIEITGLDNIGPVISLNVNSSVVSGNVDIPIVIEDVQSGLDGESVSLDDFKVTVGGNILTNGLSLEKKGFGNYNLGIENYNYEGEVVIYIEKDKISDNAGNGNADKILSTGIFFVNEYKISYNANGGSGSMSDMKCVYGKECSLTKNTYQRTGYKFLGWSLDKNATSATYSEQYKFNQFDFKKDITLYAIWQDNTPPTCTLSVTTSGIKFATTNDNVGVASSWLSTSSDATSGESSLTLSAGTKYGFVKDDAGNVGKCNVEITNAIELYTCSTAASRINSSVSCTASNYSNPSGACGNKVYSSNSCSRYNYWQANYSTCRYNSVTKKYQFMSSGNEPGRKSCGKTYGTCNASNVGKTIVSSCTPLSDYYYSGSISCYYYTCSNVGGEYNSRKCYLYNRTSCSSGWSSSVSGYTCPSSYPNKVSTYCY